MNWDTTIKITDVVIILATIAGPVLAVQAQKWLERRRAILDRRQLIFRVLMSTRAARLSAAHVEALNAIPIEFYGTNKKKREIIEAWKAYLDHLTTSGANTEVWHQKRNDLFLDLLHLISQFLGYDFNRVEIGREIYAPIGHATIESEQEIIRRGLASMFSGGFVIPVEVKNEAAKPQTTTSSSSNHGLS